MLVAALRGEYLRTCARALRYKEEIELVAEEKRRVVVSLEKTAATWDTRGREPSRQVDCPVLRSGMDAYAAEQAYWRRDMAARFVSVWNQAPKVPKGTVFTLEDEGQEVDFTLEDDGTEGEDADMDADADEDACANEDVGLLSDDDDSRVLPADDSDVE